MYCHFLLCSVIIYSKGDKKRKKNRLLRIYLIFNLDKKELTKLSSCISINSCATLIDEQEIFLIIIGLN